MCFDKVREEREKTQNMINYDRSKSICIEDEAERFEKF